MSCRAAYSSRLKPIWGWVVNRSLASKSFSATPGQDAGKKPYFITTPIFYPNSEPHLGHLYSSVVADIFARYSRLKTPSRPVLFVTGTDEHGAKIQQAALKNGLGGREQEFCDILSAKFRDLADKSNLSHTRFIRTTHPDHIVAVQHLWNDLKSRGFIYKGIHRGWYSISDECFYTDSQVESVIHPETRVVYKVSKETRNIVEWSEEENYKFRLSHFGEKLQQRYSTDQTAIVPQNQRDLTARLLHYPGNVADISISRPSRRLKWGIPVPNDPNQTIYVWLDALTAYLTAVGYPWTDGARGFAHGWPPDVQVIGKDILRFHAVYFPAFLMALEIPLPKTVLSHAHLTVERVKMSKSIGNTADPFAILRKYNSDVVRYYIARISGSYQDDKDWSDLQLEIHERELSSTLGNLVARAFPNKIIDLLPQSERYISIKPEIFAEDNSLPGARVDSALRYIIARYPNYMDNLELSRALHGIINCLGIVNRDFTEVQPWSKYANVADVSRLLSYTRETLRICGILLQPILPGKTVGLLDGLRVPFDRRTLSDANIGRGELPGDEKLPVTPTRLFDTIRAPEEKAPEKIWMDFVDG